MDRPSTSSGVRSDNNQFPEMINRMLRDVPSDFEYSDVDDSDADPDYLLPNYHSGSDADSESDPDDEGLLAETEVSDDIVVDNNVPNFVFGRLKKNEFGPAYPWHTNPATNQRVRTPAHNVIRDRLPGLKPHARMLGNKPDKKSVWDLIIDEIIINSIVTNTNVKLAKVRNGLSATTNKSTYRDTDNVEINALIGLLLLSSITKSNEETMLSMFTKDATGRPYFHATMTYKRFEILIKCLRFDNAATRDERKKTDKAAAISEVFMSVIQNSKNSYSLSECATIDEMLVPFRGRCGFRMFMPAKPHKYGIKIMCMADSKTSYLFDAYIYTGQGSDGTGLTRHEQEFSKPTQSVIRLTKDIQKTNRNITADNWFSSIETAEELLKRGLSYVGTMKKDKKIIPTEFLPDKERRVMSCCFGFNGRYTLVSMVPKRNRAVVLISTMHHDTEINQDNKKPEIVCFYNKTKAGIDLLDMKCAIYDSNRRTRRWPLAIFYRILSIASVNSFILYMCYTGSEIMTRFQFIKQLSQSLVEPHLRRRLTIPQLRRDVKQEIKRILGENQQEMQVEAVPSDKMEKRKTCGKCPSAKERKTQYKCILCSTPVCLECTRKVCLNCAKEIV